MAELLCCNCERMKAAQRQNVADGPKSSPGGRRPGAGRKPSTIKGILKILPKDSAALLERELKAKAELILVGIKLERLTKANVGKERDRKSLSDNSHIISEGAIRMGSDSFLVEKTTKSAENPATLRPGPMGEANQERQ